MQQQVDLMKSMGLMQDPLQQASGLVQLMNASQAPQMQRQQFEREMGLKELLAQQNQDFRNRSLDQQTRNQDWQRRLSEQQIGLQREAGQRDKEKMDSDAEYRKQALEFQKWAQQLGLVEGYMNRGSSYATPVDVNQGIMSGFAELLGLPGLFGSAAPAASKRLSTLPFTVDQMNEAAKR